MVKTVVFDLDGTLADTSADLLAAANVAFREMGVGDQLDMLRHAGVAMRGARAMLRAGLEQLGRGDEDHTIDQFYPVLLAAYARDLDHHTKMYPGAMAAVAALKSAGYVVAICTNKPEALAQELLTRLGVRDGFAAMLGSDTLAMRKPDPEHLFETVRRAGGDPAQCLLVGDSATDRNTALAAGVPCILVTFGPEGADMPRLVPEALLDDYAALPAVVATLLGAP